MKKIIGIGIVVLSVVACKKSAEKLESNDYVMFGHYYGFCMGEQCVETYMLRDSKLYENQEAVYGGAEGAEYVQLSSALYDEVYDLESAIPSELTELPDSTFGIPDSHDQGGVMLKIKKGDVIQRWSIDNDLDAIPAYLHAIVNLIHEKITLINN